MRNLFFVATLATSAAIDNGLGVTPPRGWRSWNQFQCAINQSLIEETYRLMVDRSRRGDPTKSI